MQGVALADLLRIACTLTDAHRPAGPARAEATTAGRCASGAGRSVARRHATTRGVTRALGVGAENPKPARYNDLDVHVLGDPGGRCDRWR
jgi:hypothetical protein